MIIELYYFALFQVSWIRHEDVQILAVGDLIFTTDTRFSSLIRLGEKKIPKGKNPNREKSLLVKNPRVNSP